MMGPENLEMGRKVETIYTVMKKNYLRSKKKKAEISACNNVRGFEENMRRNAASKACYVYINGISIPVLSA